MTRSSTGGGADNYNELRFEDKAGSEQVFLRGEKDLDIRFKNDIREYADNNRSLMVTKDQLEKVGGDLHSQVTGNSNQKIGQNLSIQVGQDLYEKSGTTFAHEAGQTIHLKAGMTMVLEAGTQLSPQGWRQFHRHRPIRRFHRGDHGHDQQWRFCWFWPRLKSDRSEGPG